MENKTIKVTGCMDCPFSTTDRGYICRLDEQRPKRKIEEDENFNPITPVWCPVKKNDIVVKYIN